MNNKNLIFMVACVLIFVLAVISVFEHRARMELSLAHETMEAGDAEAALRHFTACMAWYLPWGTAETAAEELVDHAYRWDKEGEYRLAELALHRARAGLYGARSFYTPRRDLIERADPLLANLMARRKLGQDADKDAIEKQAAKYMELYNKPSQAYLIPSLAASFGFLGWVASVFFFIWAMFGEKGRQPKRAWISAVAWAICFVIWLIGLKYA